jgi:5'-nucleotidase
LFDFRRGKPRFRPPGCRAPTWNCNRRGWKSRPNRGWLFQLVKKLLAFNTAHARNVEVVILSRNDPVSALRIFRSAKEAGLPLERGVFTQGRDPFRYLRPLGAHLFLSANEQDVSEALALGFPAARVADRIGGRRSRLPPRAADCV